MRSDLATCWRSGGSTGWGVAAHMIELMAELEAERIGFQSVTESIDTTTSGGKLVFHIFRVLAEFERNPIRERTYAGLAAARARARKGGMRKKLGEKQRAVAVDLLSVAVGKGTTLAASWAPGCYRWFAVDWHPASWLGIQPE